MPAGLPHRALGWAPRQRSPRGKPIADRQATDPNADLEVLLDLGPFLTRLSRSSRSFLKAILSAPTTSALLAEAEGVRTRWERDRTGGSRDAFDRMHHLESLKFAQA